jgi:hypothetical protein
MAGASLLGCASSSDAKGSTSTQTGGSGGSSTATFSDIYPMLFPATTDPRCNVCHSMPASNASNGSLSMGMDQASAYAALVGKTSKSIMCMGMPLVVPNQPQASLFLAKLSATPPCGGRMPNGSKPLSDAQIRMIHDWIAAGAKDD